MNWPTSQDYNEAVQDPGTSFADPDLTGGAVALNALGLPIPRSGNFADVYEFTGADGRKWALKCFTRKVPGLKERYARIDEHLTKARLPFTVGFQFLPQGIRVRGEWYPLLKMEWVEGFTLNDFVARNLDKPHHLHALMQMWAKLTARVRDAGLAHADLQHGNVLLVPGATPQKLGLKLIDYDGMWVPALAGKHSGEVGHPNFQHPLRLKDRAYDGDVDRFPHLVIAAGLRAALVGGQGLWDQFDNGDNLLFKEADLRDPANAPVFKALWALNDPVLRTLVGHIALSAGQPLKKTPWLDHVLFADGGPKLTADQERQVCALLGVTAAAPAGAAAPAAAMEREFNVFDFQADDEPATPSEKKGAVRRPTTRRKPAQKSKLPLFVGGGVAAAMLVAGAIAAVMLGGGKKDPPIEVAIVKPKEEPKPVEPGPEGPGKPPVAKKKEGDPEEPDPVPPKSKPGAEDRALWEGPGRAIWFVKEGDKWVEGAGADTRRFEFEEANRTPEYVELYDASRRIHVRLRADRCDLKEDALGLDWRPFRPGAWRPGAAAQPVVGSPRTPPIGVAALPAGRDYVFIRQGDPAVYRAVNGSARKAEIIGRNENPVHVLAVAADGSKVLTGGEAGEVRLWPLKGADGAARRKYLHYDGIETFNKRFGIDVFRENVVLRDNEKNQEATVPVGEPGHPVKGAFQRLLTNNEKAAQQLGSAVTDEVALFGGELIVQVFEGGVQLLAKGVNKTWYGWHPHRKPVSDAPAPKLTTKVSGPTTITDWTGEYEYTLYREGLLIRDLKSGKEATVPVGPVVTDSSGPFQTTIENPKSPYKAPVSKSTEVFDGAVTVQLFQHGVRMREKASKQDWNLTMAANQPDLGTDAPAGAPDPKAEPATSVRLEGHTGTVRAGAISPDGKRAVTIATDDKLIEWDLDAGKRVRRVEAPGLRAVAFLKDGRTLLVGTEDRSAELWNLDKQDKVKTLAGHTGPVTTVCVSPTWDLMFTAGADGIIRTWDVTGRAVGSLPPAGSEVTALAVSPDGRILAAGGPAGALRFFLAKTGQSAGTHTGKAGPRALAFLASGAEVIAGRAPDPVLVKLDGLGEIVPPSVPGAPVVLKLEQEADLKGKGFPSRLGYRPDGKYLWVHRDKELAVLDGGTGQTIKAWPVESVMSADFGPGKELCVVAGFRLQLWDLEKGVMLQEHPPGNLRQFLTCLPTHVPAHKLVTSPNPEVVVWDVAEWKEVERFAPYPGGWITTAVPFPDNRRYAVSVHVENVKPRYAVYDVPAKREVFRLEEPADMQRVLRFEVSPDGRWILAATHEGENGRVVVWDGRTGKHAHTVAGLETNQLGGGFSSAGDHFIACESSGRRVHINLLDGKWTDDSPGQKLEAGASAPAAGLFASLHADNKVRIWRMGAGARPAEVSPMPPAVVAGPADASGLKLDTEADLAGAPPHRIGYHPDGKYIWVGRGEEFSLRDGATGKELRSWPAANVLDADFGQGKDLYLVQRGRFQAWDLEKGTMLKEYNPPQTEGTAVSRCLPTHVQSRKLLISGRPEVIVWDAVRWREVERFTPYGDTRILEAAAYPDNRRFAVTAQGPREGKVRYSVLDAPAKREAFPLEDPPGIQTLNHFHVSPDGRWVLGFAHTFTHTGQVIVWDGRTGKLVRSVPTNRPGEPSGGFAPGGEHFVFCEAVGRRWDLHVPTGKLTPAEGLKNAWKAAAAPAAGLFASADVDGKLRIYRFGDAPKTGPKIEPKTEVKNDPKTPKTDTPAVAAGTPRESAELSDTVVGCVPSNDGKKVFVATRKGTVHVLDAGTGAETAKAEVSKAGILHLATSAKSLRLYVLDTDRQLHTYDADKLVKFKPVDLGKQAGLPAVSARARMLVAPADTYLMIFDPDETQGFSRLVNKWSEPAIPPVLNQGWFARETKTVGYAADGTVGAALAFRDLLVWQMTPFKAYPTIPTNGYTQWVGLAPEAKAVVGAGTSRLQAWRYDTRDVIIADTEPHGGQPYVGAVTGSGLITAGDDRWLRLWDLRTGKETDKWRLEDAPAGVAAPANGKTAVVWYANGRKVTLWPLPDPKAKKP